jgi:hypothetical protein
VYPRRGRFCANRLTDVAVGRAAPPVAGSRLSGILRAASRAQRSHRPLNYHHSHNLVEPEKADVDRRFGIRVTLPPGDTLRNVVGDDWERLHWYASEGERDRAFEKMARRHGYYRKTDNPTQVLEKIAR